MALPPQLPEPDSRHASERRLTDRAVFLGDLARTGKTSEGNAARETRSRFHELLEELDDEEPETPAASTSSSSSTGEASPSGSTDPSGETVEKKLETENRKDAERKSARGGEEEAEKASASQWRGPHPSMGLAMLHVAQQLQLRALDQQERTQAQRDAGDSQSLDEQSRQVEGPLLQALRQAGLSQPITGFGDPRLRSGTPLLGAEWNCSEFIGGRVFRWDGGEARQVLRWSEKDCLLETIGAGRRQVIQKVGEQFWSQTSGWDQGQDFDLQQLRPDRPL